MTPLEIIRAEYGDSRNFLTPTRVSTGKLPDGAYELSRGVGIDGELVWGVSVVRLNADGTTRRDNDAAQVFWSSTSAMLYISALRRGAEQSTVAE